LVKILEIWKTNKGIIGKDWKRLENIGKNNEISICLDIQ
jgi:hypothetical protein